VAIIRELGRTGEGYVFPGQKDGAPLSNMAMLELLKRMERGDLTVHGFRSVVPRLDSRAHQLPTRGLRNGAGAYREQSSRSGVQARRSVQQAHRAYVRMGKALRPDQTRCEGIKP
jgi:hypothetical protein